MAEKRIYDIPHFNELLWKYVRKGNDLNISFGLRPSGTVHLGNLFTLALAGEMANRIGPHVSKLVLTVLDTEAPFVGDWNFIDKKYVRHYKDLPCEGYNSFSQRSSEEMFQAMESLNEEMKVPYQLRFLSDVQRDPSFRKGLKNVLDSEESKDLVYTNGNGRVEVFPLCRNCGTSYMNSIKGKTNKYHEGIISTICSNPECDVDEYSVNVLDTSGDISVHPIMGALRDLVDPVTEVHVYGGDYASPHGESREPKIAKIKRVMEVAAPTQPLDFFVGPTIFAKGREKMSKSSHNGVTHNQLRKLFGDDYMKKVLDFTRGILDEEYSLVDFAVVQDRLLR